MGGGRAAREARGRTPERETKEATSRKRRVLETVVIDEKRLVVGVLEEEDVEKRRRSGGRREQDGERRCLEGKGSEEEAVGLWRERKPTGTARDEAAVVDKKLVAMAEASAQPGERRTGIGATHCALWNGNTQDRTACSAKFVLKIGKVTSISVQN